MVALGSSNVDASYFESGNCADVSVILPSNATNSVLFLSGDAVDDDDNESEFAYEWFITELAPGESSTEAGEYYMKNEEINYNCGAVITSFNVFD